MGEGADQWDSPPSEPEGSVPPSSPPEAAMVVPSMLYSIPAAPRVTVSAIRHGSVQAARARSALRAEEGTVGSAGVSSRKGRTTRRLGGAER